VLRGAASSSRGDWTLFACALLLLPAVSAGLRFVGLRRMLALAAAAPSGRRRAAENDPHDQTRIAWLVEIAGRCLWPRPGCLAKAFVATSLLERRGRAAQLVVGVVKTGDRLEGHAWVECDGAAVGVHPGRRGYAVLARIPGRRPRLAIVSRHERLP
jgi:hypothetical protein